VLFLHTISQKDLGARDTFLSVKLFKFGWIGVLLFFCISGFILSMPFAEHYFGGSRKPSVKKYFLRRLTRLEPPFIMNLALCFFLLMHEYGQNAAYLLNHFLVSIVYMHNLVYHKISLINGVIWSLEIEVQFYILAPVLAGLFAIRNTLARRSVFVLLIAAGAIMMVFVPTEYQSTHKNLLFYYHYFLCGFLMVDIFINDWKKSPSKTLWWDAVALASLGFAVWFSHEIMVVLVVLAFFACAFRGVLLNKICTNRWIIVIGGMCYTLYLYHPLAMKLTDGPIGSLIGRSLPPQLGYLTRALVSVSASILLCALPFIALEKPFMVRDWPSKLASAVRSLPRRIRPDVAESPNL